MKLNGSWVSNGAHNERLFLPLALRLAKTFRPPLVAMRALKPLALFPFNLVGDLKFFFIRKKF